MSARAKLPPELADLLRSELDTAMSHHLAYIIEEVKRVAGKLNMRKGAS